MTIILI